MLVQKYLRALIFLFVPALVFSQSPSHYTLVKTITGKLSPKSINNNGRNIFFAQNMMYNHSITVYDSNYNLITTISDLVKPSEFNLQSIKGTLNGAPVESAATKDGKYLWVSNYNMIGSSYTNPGCDTCCCKGYDESMVYKINTQTFKIENIVEVGSVPKYLTITPDQKKLLVSNWSSGDVSIIDLETEKEIKRIFVGPAPRGIACDSANAYIAVMGCNKITKINLCSFQSETFVSGICNPRHLCIDKNYLYASLNGEQSVCRIDLTDKRIKKLNVGRAPRSMVISRINDKLYVDCYEDSKIAIIDLNTFTLASEITTHSYPIGICLNNNNSQIWVSCYTGCIQVFEDNSKNLTGPGKNVKTIAVQSKEHPATIGYTSIANQLSIPLTQEQKEITKCYVVLGSFSVKEHAVRLKNILQKKGVQTELMDSKKGYVYCVCKTKKNKEESEKLVTKLEVLTGIKGWLYVI